MNTGVPRLLILEDNDEDFVAIEIASQEFGRTVRLERYTRAEPLIEQAKHETLEYPSLALLDLRMPGGGGIEALQALKADFRLRTVPCIVLSTSTNPKEIEQCYRFGANAFHEKLVETPKMIERLTAIFRYWLEEAHLAPPTRSESHGE